MSSKRTRMVEIPSRLLEETKRTSETLRIASSSGWVTSFSTSSAEAPRNGVVMLIQLKLISGSCSRGICM